MSVLEEEWQGGQFAWSRMSKNSGKRFSEMGLVDGVGPHIGPPLPVKPADINTYLCCFIFTD